MLGAKGLDEPKDTLRHDRKGLLTKAREQDAVDSVFDITLGPCPERDGRATVFGIVLEGMDVLGQVASVPVYTMEAAGGQQPEALDTIFVQQVRVCSAPSVCYVHRLEVKLPPTTSTIYTPSFTCKKETSHLPHDLHPHRLSNPEKALFKRGQELRGRAGGGPAGLLPEAGRDRR